MAVGNTNPAKLPVMFIIPETVPAYSWPTSMQTAQHEAIVISPKNDAMEMVSTAVTGSWIATLASMQIEPTRNPEKPIYRRFFRLPVRLTT